MKLFSFSIFFAICFSSAVWARKDLPSDVRDLLSRMQECEHWAGEEAYDEERKMQIAAGIDKARCADLESDKKKALQKYKAQPQILKKLNQPSI